MEITSGRIQRGKKLVVYGPEGIGKSTFAAAFPSPVFIDTEGSTYEMDVRRFDRPESWTMLKAQVEYIITHKDICKTLCIDTIDWAERLCSTEICAKNHMSGIEDFGYGKGYTFLGEEFGRLLNRLDDIANLGINVVITAHCIMRKFEQPDSAGAYDRFELKLSKQCAPMLKEWSDCLLFANYKVTIVTTKDKTKKGTGGERIMYTTHHPCWDAKNRWGMPDELPFSFAQIAPVIPCADMAEAKVDKPAPEAPPPRVRGTAPASKPTPEPAPDPRPAAEEVAADEPDVVEQAATGIPLKIQQLIDEAQVTEEAVRNVVYQKGYFPYEMPISDYPEDFIEGWLLPFFPKVVEVINNNLPF